jgi:hypothetical protein
VSSSLSRHTTPEKLFIEACDEGADAVLAIDRLSNEMTFTGRHNAKWAQLFLPKTNKAGLVYVIIVNQYTS